MDVTAQYAGQALGDVEQVIRGLENEVACVFAPSGELVFAEQGSAHDLDLSDTHLVQMKGTVLTHNHPSSIDSFSFDDVSLAWEAELTDLRMVNSSYTFTLSGMPGFYGWWEVDETIRALMRQVIEDRDAGLVDADEVFHILWERVAARLGLSYTRTNEAQ